MNSSETCIIKDIVDDGDVNRISFTLQNGDVFERIFRETDVLSLRCISS